MPHHVDAWLRHQQHRWLRPDAARWLRPDAGRFLRPGTDLVEAYPALHAMEAKGRPDQPRVPRGDRNGGRWTRDGVGGGRSAGRDGALSPSDGASGDEAEMLPEIEVVASSEPSTGSDFLSGFWSDLDSLIGSIGNIQGSPSDDPPNVPDSRPSRSSTRIGVVRAVSNWLARNAGLVADFYFGFQRNIDWLQDYQDVIRANRDPPKTLEELMDGVGKKRPGYDDHHIMERTAAERWGLTQSEINDPSNLVSIPRLKHYQITGWYATRSDRFGGLSPREYLSDKSPEERRRVGLDALRMFEVLKP